MGLFQVGERDLQVLVVGGEINISSDVGDLVHVDGGQVDVVGNVEVTNGLEVNSGQGGEESVGDHDAVGLRDTLGECELRQVSEGFELDGADGSQRVEGQALQLGHSLEGELVSNALEIGG